MLYALIAMLNSEGFSSRDYKAYLTVTSGDRIYNVRITKDGGVVEDTFESERQVSTRG